MKLFNKPATPAAAKPVTARPTTVKPPPAPVSRFAAIESAEVYHRAPNFRVGRYLCCVNHCEFSDKRSGTFFILNTTICEAHQTDPAITPNAVGSEAASVQEEKKEGFLGRVRGALAAVLNVDPSEVNGEVFARATDHDPATEQPLESPVDPLAGRLVWVTAQPATTKKGEQITGVSFAPAEGNSDAEIAERRAQLGLPSLS